MSNLPIPRVFRSPTIFGDDGFSLVELLLSLALTGMVMALTVPFAHLQKRLWEGTEERREAGRALAGSLAWLTRDLQQAGYHDPGSPIRQIASGVLSYVVSRDEGDPAGFSPANRRLITVWRDGPDLKYKIQAPLAPPAVGWASGSTQILASGVSAMRCRGLDGGGGETTVPAQVALVDCALSGAAGMQERVLVRLRCGPRAMGP
ncbi:MAG: prepilin-type N-terminal cleavage/methylation domain-containing protein [Candidatus Methylomirabilia bacterium]